MRKAGASKKDGVEELRQDANRLLAKFGGEISQEIVEKARHGDTSSVKLLVTLADKRKARGKPGKEGSARRWLEELAREPEYEGAKPGTASSAEPWRANREEQTASCAGKGAMASG